VSEALGLYHGVRLGTRAPARAPASGMHLNRPSERPASITQEETGARALAKHTRTQRGSRAVVLALGALQDAHGGQAVAGPAVGRA
jgi:hypothetical protein